MTELRTSGPPVGCGIIQMDDLETWLISMSVLGDETETVYAGGKIKIVRMTSIYR